MFLYKFWGTSVALTSGFEQDSRIPKARSVVLDFGALQLLGLVVFTRANWSHINAREITSLLYMLGKGLGLQERRVQCLASTNHICSGLGDV